MFGCGGPALAEDPNLTWPEAEVLRQPVKPAKLTGPRVLVRRRTGALAGPSGEELIYLPGPAAISLFTGCGGMDLGIEAAGFCTLVQHEWDAAACEALLVNRPRAFRHSALIQGDIRNTPTSLILSEAGLRVGECHLLTGGPPCQGFSFANANRGQRHDWRNDLVFQFLRVVRESQPKLFIMENVPGFVQLNKSAYLKAFLKAAFGAYYEIVYGLADACEYGVPQYRCRFFACGTRRDLWEIEHVLSGLPKPQNFADSDLQVIREIDGVPLLAPLYAPRYESLTRAPGIRYFPDRPLLIPPRPRSNHDIGGDRTSRRSKKFMAFYDKLAREEPDRLVREPKESLLA